LIGLAGGSGSGKTTIAEEVVERLDGRVALLHHDAYYRNLVELSFDERTRVNYDHPQSLETELLITHIRALRLGRAVEHPVYDFSSHLRSDETIRIEPAPVVVVEGILVLSEPALRSELDLKTVTGPPTPAVAERPPERAVGRLVIIGFRHRRPA
jgi:uridine kinase